MNEGAKPHGQASAKTTVIVIAIVLVVAVGIRVMQKVSPADLNSKKADTAKELEQAKQVQDVETQKIGSFDETKIGKILPVRQPDDKDHVWGNLTAPVRVIVYDDFECPFCAEYYDTIDKAKKEFGDKIAIVFRHFPLTNIHPYALKAAEASECAAEQGKFWEMYNRLYADNKASQLYDSQVKADAKALQLDTAKFDQCFDTDKYREEILAEMAEAKTFNVNGSPTTFVNDEIVIGANPYEDMVASDGRKIEGLKTIITRLLQK